jgi:hypothetical protein
MSEVLILDPDELMVNSDEDNFALTLSLKMLVLEIQAVW